MINDKRAQHRVSFFMGGDFYATPTGERVGRTVVRDVSSSGVRVETLTPLDVGQTIYLDFSITQRFPFQKVPMTVVRVYRHTGTFLVGARLANASDRRRMRQALASALQNEV